jgi:hypothetical protein
MDKLAQDFVPAELPADTAAAQFQYYRAVQTPDDLLYCTQ